MRILLSCPIFLDEKIETQNKVTGSNYMTLLSKRESRENRDFMIDFCIFHSAFDLV